MSKLSPEDRKAIREAFFSNQLQVEAVDPKGNVGFHTVTGVLRHEVPHKRIFEVTLDTGASVVATEDHSLFWYSEDGWFGPIETGKLKPGMATATVVGGKLCGARVTSVVERNPQRYMYDLSVPGPENFVLKSGILAHNSYSIGGISLDINKSSQYESLKQNAEQQFDKATAAKQLTVKIIRGLAQPRFGAGIRSSFGPFLGRGGLGPRSFI